MSTEIEKLREISESAQPDSFIFDEKNLNKTIVDLSIPLSDRLKALDLFYQLKGSDETVEFVNKLCTMYELSGTANLRIYLYDICVSSSINSFLKSIIVVSLYNMKQISNKSLCDAIDIIYPQMNSDKSIGTPYKIDFVKMMMDLSPDEDYREKALSHFHKIVNSPILDCVYRYKTIFNLSNTSINNKEWFIKMSLLEFIKDSQNKPEYRILGCQYILNSGETKVAIDILKNLANDENTPYNSRADSADVLLKYGNENDKTFAKCIIDILAKNGKNIIHSLYENAQNVHTEEIEASVLECIEYLQTIPIMKINGKEIDIDYVVDEIKKINDTVSDSILTSLNRIYLDRALYSKYNCSLKQTLIRIWSFICDNEFRKELEKRLLEELHEMAGTCSSGYITRLINTISGYSDFSLRISWRDQISSNFTGRLNALIRNMDNLTAQEKILNEMTLDTTLYEERKNFLKFLRKNMLNIREEMESEFSEHLDETTFDLYFRGAISMYETGEFM
jgi:hypothetical protein